MARIYPQTCNEFENRWVHNNKALVAAYVARKKAADAADRATQPAEVVEARRADRIAIRDRAQTFFDEDASADITYMLCDRLVCSDVAML